MKNNIKLLNRIEYMYFFDAVNSNPNGDPTTNNTPRIDPETNIGIVTDVCLKRKIRNYLLDVHDVEMYITERSVLKEQKAKALKEKGKDEIEQLCKYYYDIRAFGAVLPESSKPGKKDKKSTTSPKTNDEDENNSSRKTRKIRGPIQLTFAKSVEPVSLLDLTITRVARENPNDDKENQSMGRKVVVPYALYVCNIYVNPFQAYMTGFDEEDLCLFEEALLYMWELDRSALRPCVNFRKIIKFLHTSPYGDTSSEKLFSRVKVQRKDTSQIPRSIEDYVISIDNQEIKDNVYRELVGSEP